MSADVERTASMNAEKKETGVHTPPGDSHPPLYDVAILNTDYEDKPSEEEMHTLRRVPGKLPVVAFLLCAVEFCERASYYGMELHPVNAVSRGSSI